MRQCQITAIRRSVYADLSEQFENPIKTPCTVSIGQSFCITEDRRPDGLCESAWETIRPFVCKLLKGEGNFFDGWMKDPDSAVLSCNDGFRPVSFLIECKEV